jgi:hypothetical protein
MRVAAFISILCVGFTVVPQSAIAVETVTRCALGSNANHSLNLLREHRIDNTAVYYLSKDGAVPSRLYPGDEDQSRGDEVQATCVGSKEHAFVISGEFTSNYLQGVAIRYNSSAKRWERIDFAERTRPVSVYLDSQGLAVLIPNTGRNESPKRYIIYRYNANTGNAERTYSDRRPRSRAVRIPGH